MQQPVGYPGSQRRGGETDETIEEQGLLARLVHLIQAPDNDTQLKVCIVTQENKNSCTDMPRAASTSDP